MKILLQYFFGVKWLYYTAKRPISLETDPNFDTICGMSTMIKSQ
jgi:hypothetical protein